MQLSESTKNNPKINDNDNNNENNKYIKREKRVIAQVINVLTESFVMKS